MKNPLTLKVELWLGSFIVLMFSVFLLGLFLIAVRDFSSDTETISFSTIKLRTVSPAEKLMIDNWLRQNNIEPPSIRDNYRYFIRNFPDKPWLNNQ